MNVVAIVQARMTSSRLPGKVLMDLAGQPMLTRVVGRLRRAARVTDVRIACTERPDDDPIAELAKRLDAGVFRGSETDVLGRYVATAREARADVVVRVTADCPLLDPAVVDRVAGALLEARSRADYAANVLRRTYPRGLDVEALYLDTLLRAERFATTPEAREHVTLAVREDPAGRFAVVGVEAEQDDSDLRWTVDTADDLAHVVRLHRELPEADRLGYLALVAWCRAHPAGARQDDQSLTWDPTRRRNPAIHSGG